MDKTITLSPTVQRVLANVERTRRLRDEEGWPEPRTIDDLRTDPRVQLRNRLDAGDENLELAAALILMVAEDRESQPEQSGRTVKVSLHLDGKLITEAVHREISRQLAHSGF